MRACASAHVCMLPYFVDGPCLSSHRIRKVFVHSSSLCVSESFARLCVCMQSVSLYSVYRRHQKWYKNCLLYSHLAINAPYAFPSTSFSLVEFLLSLHTYEMRLSIHPSVYPSLSLYPYIRIKWMWQLTKHRLFKLNGSIFLNFAIYLIAVKKHTHAHAHSCIRKRKWKMVNGNESEWRRTNREINRCPSYFFHHPFNSLESNCL